MKPTIEAIICDFDDTIMATSKVRIPILIDTVKEYGQIVDMKKLQRNWGKPFKYLIKSIAPSIDYKSFLISYSNKMRKCKPVILPGVIDLFQFLNRNRIPIDVVTSGSRRLVQQDLKEGNLWKYIHLLWAFEDSKFHKPDHRVLYPILRTFLSINVSKNNIIYFGDSLIDYKVAKSNGISFFGILTGNTSRDEFLQNGVNNKNIFRTINEFLITESSFRRFFLPGLSP
jgi:phosphoglycolate phosphatase-like HAD superfamily hydrolase